MNKDAAAFEKKIKTMTEEEFKAMLIKDMFAFEALDEAAFEEEFKNKSEEEIKAMKQFVAAFNKEIEAMNKLNKAAKEEIKNMTEEEIKAMKQDMAALKEEIEAMSKDATAFEKKIKNMTEEEVKAVLIKDMMITFFGEETLNSEKEEKESARAE